MSELVEALDRLVGEHERIGSPLPDYLLPGLPSDDVRARIEELGLRVPGEVMELLAWHNGTAAELDGQPDVHRPGLAEGFPFTTLDETVTSYRGARSIDRIMARLQGEPHSPTWRPSWLPLFGERYFIDCDVPPSLGNVFAWQYHPPADGWDQPTFRDLTHLVRSLVRRFEAGVYYMNRCEEGYLELDFHWEVLARLRELEILEASAQS